MTVSHNHHTLSSSFIILLLLLLFPLILLSSPFTIIIHSNANTIQHPNEKLPTYSLRRRPGEIINILYEVLSSTDPSLSGMVVSTVINNNNNNKQYQISKAFGHAPRGGKGRGPNYIPPITIDSNICMNTMYELLLSAAIIKIQLDYSFITSLDNNISSEYSPGGKDIVHPATGKIITYRQLLLHTSSILDSDFNKYLKSNSGGSNSVGTLEEFIDDYFLSSDGSIKNNNNIFSNISPGTPQSYHFSKTNIALVAYILNKVIKSSKLKDFYNSIDDYISKEFLLPFGMQNTVFLNKKGSPPMSTVVPDYNNKFININNNINNIDYYSITGYFGNIMHDGSSQIHPAFVSDYMGYTSISDLSKLIEGLFIKPLYKQVSHEMQQVFVSVVTSGAEVEGGERYNNNINNNNNRGMGLMFYTPNEVCQAGIETMIIKSCPFKNDTKIFGYSTYRDGVEIGFICSKINKRSSLMCVVSGFLYNNNNAEKRGARNVLAAAATVFQDISGDFIVEGFENYNNNNNNNNNTEEDSFFGIYVFLVVFGTLIFIYFVYRCIMCLFFGGVIINNMSHIDGVITSNNAQTLVIDKLSPGKVN